jgi:hypothetical protein
VSTPIIRLKGSIGWLMEGGGMRLLTGASLLLAILIVVVPLCASARTPAASTSPDSVRFGWISRYNRGMQPDPIVDRYVGNIRDQIARAAGVTTVDLPGTPLEPEDYVRFCKALNLRGFIESAVGFRNDALEVSGSGSAIVTDCNGQIFFADYGAKLEPRDAAESVASQRETHRKTRLSISSKNF